MNKLANLAENTQYFATTVILLAALIALLMEAVYIFGIRYYLQKKWFNSWLRTRKLRNLEKKQELKESQYSLINKMKDAQNTEKEQYQKELKEIESYLSLREKISKYMESTLPLTRKFRKFNESGVYSLPFQKLCGQISNIIQTELDYPFSEGSSFLYFFAASANSSDLEKISRFMEKQNNIKESPNNIKESNENKEYPQKLSDSEAEEIAEIRQRLYYHVEREIDDLQVYLGQKWNQMDYIVSISSAFLFVVLLISLHQSSKVPILTSIGSNLLIYLVILAAGLLAPIVRNLLERWVVQR